MKIRFVIFILTLFIPCFALADELIIEPEMGRAPILKTINHAKHSIDLVIYGFTDQTLLDAILKQHNHGRSVKIILEKTPYKATNENKHTIEALNKAKIDWIGEVPPFHLIHQKTLITDDNKAMVMTFNFTRSTFKNSRNFGLILDDPKTVKEIERVFAADWNHVPLAEHSPDLLYSPDDSRVKLLKLVRDSKQSIKIYAQSITDYQFIGTLAAQARKGVSVSILTSNSMKQKAQNYLLRAGVKIYRSKHFYIHAKVFIFDDDKAVIGSINLTRYSFDTNRELSVITHDKTVVKQLTEQFEKDITSNKTT